MNITALQRRVQSLEDQARRRFPEQTAPPTLEHLTEIERAGLEAFNDHMQAIGKVNNDGPAPRLMLEQLTDDELDQALYWSNVIHRKVDRV